MKIFLSLFSFFFLLSSLNAQSLDISPEIDPVFFGANDEITISYEVTGTYMADWSAAWLWTWLPEDSNADAPTNINPANTNSATTDLAKFTKVVDAGKTFFQLAITPNQFFTGVSSNITSIGMLIKGNDWGDGQSVDYVVEVGDGLRLLVNNPTGNFGFYEPGENINISVQSSIVADLEILIDNVSVATATQNQEITFDHSVIVDDQIHTINITGTTIDENVSVEYKYLVPPTVVNEPIPSGTQAGINYNTSQGEVTLVLEAPNKKSVFLIGDFNDWEIDNDYYLKKDGDFFWITLSDLNPSESYRFQYLVDGDLRIADPYAERISSPFDDGQIINENRYPDLAPYPFDKTSEGVSFLQINPTDEYQWTTQNFARPAKEDLIIYELLVRDFTEQRTFEAVIEKLDYLKSLGINGIELMPVMEFEGNISWGYNPAFMFSVDKFYGTENKLKELIDKAHEKGIAVILDIVLNHAFGRCPLVRLDNDDLYGPPTVDNVWLNRTAKHDFNVGYDFNHESEYTKRYVDRVNEFWINEYKIDGFRFDLSKGFTQKQTIGNVGAWGAYDASRITLLKRMADHIWSVDPENYIILEHFAANSEEEELADYGMMLWGNMTGSYRAITKGNPASISSVYHETRDWENPHLIGYMESHDEERVIYEVTKSIDLPEALDRAKASAIFFLLVPGPKMIWQFEELGYDEELNNDRLGIKPTRWEYLDIPARKKLHDVFTSMINLRTQTNYIQSEYFSWEPTNRLKWININHPDVQIAAFGNFSKLERSENVKWPANGTWINYFSGETIEVEDAENYEMIMAPGEVQVFTSQPIDNYIEENPLNIVSNPAPPAPIVITVNPNPSDDMITISFPAGIHELVVTNAVGQIMHRQGIPFTDESITLSIKDFAAGVYTFTLRNRKQITSTKFFKHR